MKATGVTLLIYTILYSDYVRGGGEGRNIYFFAEPIPFSSCIDVKLK